MALEDGPEASPSTQPQEFPELPTMLEFEEPSMDLLEGFEHFMELTPHASAANFAAHSIQETMPQDVDTPAAQVQESAVPPGQDHAQERRVFRNRLSQRRFRQRQRVRPMAHSASDWISTHEVFLLSICNTVTVRQTRLYAGQNTNVGGSARGNHSTTAAATSPAGHVESQKQAAAEAGAPEQASRHEVGT